MAQFLRPDGNITQTSFTGGFAEIDESAASDTDFAYGANNTAAVLEVSLSNPSGTPAAGTTTVRYRIAKTNNGTVDGAGNAVTVTAEVYQGGSLIASDTARTATGTWTAYSFTPDMSGVTDWNDLRLRFTTSSSGGSPANRRGGAVSWAELESPDAAPAVTHSTSGALVGGGAAIVGSANHSFPEESFDPANKDADITLSNNDKTATNTANSVNNTAIGETGKSTGKWYFEASTTDVGGGTDSHKVGIVNSSVNPTNYELGNDANSIAYRGFDGNANKGGITQATYTAWTTPSTTYRIMVALDATNEIVWFGLNGTWNGDPAAGTGGIDISSLGGGALKAAVGLYNTSTPAVAMTGAFSDADVFYTPPSGFTAWGETAGPVTHATTGDLVGQGSVVAGSATNFTVHATSGALVGQGSTVAGSATRFRAHSTSGALQGQGTDVTGAAARFRTFDTSGALVGQGSNVTGSANRFRAFDASGSLVGGGATISGSAAREGSAVTHDTSGTLSAGTASVAGGAARFRAFDTSGALTGAGSNVIGAAERFRAHGAVGALSGASATLAGSAARTRAHASTGALAGNGAALSGSAARSGAPVSHAASGVLVGAGAVLVGAGTTPLGLTDTQKTAWAKRYSGVRRSKG